MTKCHVMFQRKNGLCCSHRFFFFSRKYKVHGSHLQDKEIDNYLHFICIRRYVFLESNYISVDPWKDILNTIRFFFFQDYPSKAQNLRAIVHAYLLHESFFLWWTNCSSLDWWMTALRLMSCWQGRCRGTRIQRPEVGLLVQGNR